MTALNLLIAAAVVTFITVTALWVIATLANDLSNEIEEE